MNDNVVIQFRRTGRGSAGTAEQPSATSGAVQTVVASYVRHLGATGRGAAAVRAYRPRLVGWLDWCAERGIDWQTFPPDEVAAYGETCAPGRSTRVQVAAALSAAGEMVGVSDAGAPVPVPRRSGKPRWRGLTDTQVRALLAACDGAGRAGLATRICVYTALRRSEVASLRWDGIDGDQRRMVVARPKNDDWHVLPIHPALLADLELRRPDDVRMQPFVFAGRWGGHVSPATVGSWVGQVSEVADVGHVTPHQLRHTAAVACYLASGNDLTVAQRLLGHADPRTTAIYVQASLPQIEEALNQMTYGLAAA